MHIKFFLVDQEGNEEDLFLSYPSKITTYDMMKANQYSEDILNGISSNIKLCKREFGKVIFDKYRSEALKYLQKKNKRIPWYSGIPLEGTSTETLTLEEIRIGQFPILKYIMEIQRISQCNTLMKMNLYDVSDFVFNQAYNINMKKLIERDWVGITTKGYPDLYKLPRF